MDRRVVPPNVQGEVEEEFAHHVEMRVRDLVAAGWDEADARVEALRRFEPREELAPLYDSMFTQFVRVFKKNRDVFHALNAER